MNISLINRLIVVHQQPSKENLNSKEGIDFGILTTIRYEIEIGHCYKPIAIEGAI